MKNYLKAANNNGAKASYFLANRLKSTAPIKSGRLIQSVRRRKTKNGWSVLAGYSGARGFNVGRWINQEFSVSFRLDSFQPFFMAGQTLRYGQPALAPSGNPIMWTAKESPWFTNNARRAISRYRAGYKSISAKLRG